MKKPYLIAALFSVFAFGKINAEEHIVHVSNFSFSPSNLTVEVGDVITWHHMSGFHNTTSASIPVGAAPWMADISSTATTFSYTVAVVGTYSYTCTLHFGMNGSFTAVSPVSVARLSNTEKDMLNARAIPGALILNYSLSNSGPIDIELFGLDGKMISVLKSTALAAGTYTETIELNDLRTGVYLVRMRHQQSVLTQRVFIAR